MHDFSAILRRFVILAFIMLVGLGGYHCKKQEEIPITTQSSEAKEIFLQARELGDNLYLKKAVSLLSEAIDKDPEFALAYLYRGRFTGEPQELKMDLQRAVELKSNVSPGEQEFINAYHAYYEEDDIDKAIGFLEEVVFMYPKDKHIRARLGGFYQLQNKSEMAIEEFNRAIALDENFAPAYLDLGYTYTDMGDYDKAEEAFQNYIRLIPDQPNPYDSIADLYSTKGEFDKAIEYYQQALERDPNFLDSQRKIGANMALLGQYDDGRKTIQTVIHLETAPDRVADAMALMVRSFVYEQNYAEALNAADEAIRFALDHDMPVEVVVHYLVKCALQTELGNHDDADASLEICRSIFQNVQIPTYFRDIYSDSIHFWEAMVAAKKKDFQKAIAIANQYRDNIEMSQNPNRMKYHLGLLGCIECERGYPEIAVEYFRHAEIDEPLFLYYAACAESKAGNRANAMRYFRKAANWNQDDMWYALIRANARARQCN